MGGGLNETQQIYEQLWQKAASAFAAGRPGIDPHLPDKAHDSRRGVTLLLRPNQAVQRSINAFLGELAEVAPGQYFYRPEEFHVTVLSIVPGSELWRDKIRPLITYRSIVSKVLKAHREFSIGFRGITASANAVMVQGFPAADTLRQIRDHLREELRKNNMADELARKYQIQTAHLTIMRFCRLDTDWNRIRTLLEANRETPFGETRVQSLQLVLTDWYASAERIMLLEEYKLE
jgi:2'-5' RNA ligase